MKLFKYRTAQPRVSALGASSLLDCYSVDSRFVQLHPQNVRESYVGSASNPHEHWAKHMLPTTQARYPQTDFHNLPQGEKRAQKSNLPSILQLNTIVFNSLQGARGRLAVHLPKSPVTRVVHLREFSTSLQFLAEFLPPQLAPQRVKYREAIDALARRGLRFASINPSVGPRSI